MIIEKSKRSRWIQLFWAALFFIVILTFIWHDYDPARRRLFYILSLSLMIVINYFYDEGFNKVGLWPDNFKKPFLEYWKILAGLSVLILFLGFLFGTARYSDPLAMIKGLVVCLLWGLFQQYLLNGFFVNRLAGFFENDKDPIIPLIAASLFT